MPPSSKSHSKTSPAQTTSHALSGIQALLGPSWVHGAHVLGVGLVLGWHLALVFGPLLVAKKRRKRQETGSQRP